jgi:hypothetical protein
MSRLLCASRIGLLLLAGAALAAGCAPAIKVEPVSGKVTVSGQPVTSGQVTLIPVEKGEKNEGLLSSGPIDETGAYQIHTGGKAGAPPGKYKVTVNPSMVPTGGTTMPTAPYNAVYKDPTNTPLKIEVPSSAPGAYDLKLTK